MIDEAGLVGRLNLVSVLVAELFWEPLRSGIDCMLGAAVAVR